MVEAALRLANPGIQIQQKIIHTSGDKRLDLRFSEFAQGERLDKGIFTKELEIALHLGEIDFAVHSLKDVPTVLDDAFSIVAVLPRAPIEDVLISRDGYTLECLPQGAKVGTSSVRRIRQLKWIRPDLQCVEIRGNVPTRLRKLNDPSELDAILLAKAGLDRLGLLGECGSIHLEGTSLKGSILPEEAFFPAAGQGAIGMEARLNDTETLDLLATINHDPTFARVTAEREFLHLLKAGCQTPIGALTHLECDDVLSMKVWVFDEDASKVAPVELQASGVVSHPKEVAAKLVQALQAR